MVLLHVPVQKRSSNHRLRIARTMHYETMTLQTSMQPSSCATSSLKSDKCAVSAESAVSQEAEYSPTHNEIPEDMETSEDARVAARSRVFKLSFISLISLSISSRSNRMKSTSLAYGRLTMYVSKDYDNCFVCQLENYFSNLAQMCQ